MIGWLVYWSCRGFGWRWRSGRKRCSWDLQEIFNVKKSLVYGTAVEALELDAELVNHYVFPDESLQTKLVFIKDALTSAQGKKKKVQAGLTLFQKTWYVEVILVKGWDMVPDNWKLSWISYMIRRETMRRLWIASNLQRRSGPRNGWVSETLWVLAYAT